MHKYVYTSTSIYFLFPSCRNTIIILSSTLFVIVGQDLTNHFLLWHMTIRLCQLDARWRLQTGWGRWDMLLLFASRSVSITAAIDVHPGSNSWLQQSQLVPVCSVLMSPHQPHGVSSDTSASWAVTLLRGLDFRSVRPLCQAQVLTITSSLCSSKRKALEWKLLSEVTISRILQVPFLFSLNIS